MELNQLLAAARLSDLLAGSGASCHLPRLHAPQAVVEQC
jgi:hypothetical protein